MALGEVLAVVAVEVASSGCYASHTRMHVLCVAAVLRHCLSLTAPAPLPPRCLLPSALQCGLSSRILEVLRKGGFEKPLAIQAQALPGGWRLGPHHQPASNRPLISVLLCQPPGGPFHTR